MSKRIQFDWSQLDRYNLTELLYSLKKSVVGQPILVSDLQKILRKHLKEHLPVKIKTIRSFDGHPGHVSIGGCYYAENDQNNQNSIEISFLFHPFDEHLKFNPSKWMRVSKLFADTLLHELIHMHQYRSRKFVDIPGYESVAHKCKQRKQQEYYGHKDEIVAYSFNIACELLDKYNGNREKAIGFLHSHWSRKNRKMSYYRYLATFGFDTNHPVMKQLKKRIVKNFDMAEIGKPFKYSIHLTY